jgi:branched-chain amino acid transport system ATP-binding protein
MATRSYISIAVANRQPSLSAPRTPSGARERPLEHFPALAEALPRRAGLLSGGEQQMLAIARSMAGAPRLLIIDELSLGLAPPVVDQLLAAVCKLAHESGVGLLLIEQHVDKVTRVSDRVLHLTRGVLH